MAQWVRPAANASVLVQVPVAPFPVQLSAVASGKGLEPMWEIG